LIYELPAKEEYKVISFALGLLSSSPESCINGRGGSVFCAVERYGAADLDEQGGMKWWAHQDLNLGPIDYEDPGDPAPVTLR